MKNNGSTAERIDGIVKQLEALQVEVGEIVADERFQEYEEVLKDFDLIIGCLNDIRQAEN
jgi:hypothetical protein